MIQKKEKGSKNINRASWANKKDRQISKYSLLACDVSYDNRLLAIGGGLSDVLIIDLRSK